MAQVPRSSKERRHAFLSTSAIVTDSQTDTLPEFVLNTIKYDSLQRFSTPLPRSRFQNSGLEGFQGQEITVAVKSDLETFKNLTRSLHQTSNSETSSSSVRFLPNFAVFENPSRASNNLSVDFEYLSDLLYWMGVMEITDHRTFGWKSTSQKHGAMLRVVGTSCVLYRVKRPNSMCTVDVDCFMPFTSKLSFRLEQIRQLLETTNTEGTEKASATPIQRGLNSNVVLFRYRENYDEAQGRFVSPWRAQTITWSSFTNTSPSTSSYNTVPSVSTTTSSSSITSTTDCDSTFSVEWSRSAALSSKNWTDDATFFGRKVMGSITVFFPIVTFFGASTLAEIDNLLDLHCS